MLNIPRSLARQLRAVFTRALGKSRRGDSWAKFHATADELVVQATSEDIAVEYRVSDRFEPADFVLPLELLRDCEAKLMDAVAFDRADDGRVTAYWEHRGIPQQRTGDVPTKELPEFPPMPTEFASNDPGFLKALADAAEISDPDSTRYALGCIALRDGGKVVSTDGSQALVQSGYAFPFSTEALVPATAFFGCKELPQDQPVRIGCTEQHVTLVVGPWTIHLKTNGGRFPRVQDSIPAVDAATSRLSLDNSDSEFLAERINNLPYHDGHFLPVTLDLNGQVIVRARGAETSRPTELVLSHSRLEGQPMRLSTNRKYLAHAAKLGLREFCLYAPGRPVLAHDERRQYVWMGLGEDDVVQPAADAQRIESPQGPQRISNHRNRIKEMNVTQSVPMAAEAPAAVRKPRKRSCPAATETPFEQAIALRDTLHAAAKLANELAREFKHQKRQARIVQSTLASLKQLQKAAG